MCWGNIFKKRDFGGNDPEISGFIENGSRNALRIYDCEKNSIRKDGPSKKGCLQNDIFE